MKEKPFWRISLLCFVFVLLSRTVFCLEEDWQDNESETCDKSSAKRSRQGKMKQRLLRMEEAGGLEEPPKEREKALPLEESMNAKFLEWSCPRPKERAPGCEDFDRESFASAKTVINLKCDGRLGNQMFRIAYAYALSRRLGVAHSLFSSQAEALETIFKLDPLWDEDGAGFLRLDERYCDPCKLPWQTVTQKGLQKDVLSQFPIGRAFKNFNYYFSLADVKIYLDDIRDKVFEFRDDVRREAAARMADALRDVSGDVVLVGVHVRRGDMRGHLGMPKYGGDVVGKDYYDRAREIVRSELKGKTVRFLVVTDDLKWVQKELLEGQPDTVVVSSGKKDPDDKNGSESFGFEAGVDLAVLSSCDRVVMSHGTFGLWGAMLSGGPAVAPFGFAVRREPEELAMAREADFEGWQFVRVEPRFQEESKKTKEVRLHLKTMM